MKDHNDIPSNSRELLTAALDRFKPDGQKNWSMDSDKLDEFAANLEKNAREDPTLLNGDSLFYALVLDEEGKEIR